jgi:predicted nucleotide-binding protein
MPYHINIVVEGDQYYEYDQKRDSVEILSVQYVKGKPFILGGVVIDPHKVSKIRIYQTKEKSGEIIGARVWDTGRDVTRYFISSLPSKSIKLKFHRKNVFIVHGRDHKPVKELKLILSQFGLNPIVLHEQPSGSRTIVEKLEKYSDVGYAFVTLTPDDVGGPKHKHYREWMKVAESMCGRARQNVILEFGYFIGKLGRDKVCCLHKGDVELPSDMHGIVYIPFKDSVNEVRDKINKELKEAGYEIKL